MELRGLSELSEDYITDGLLYLTGNPQIFGISPFAPADFQASSATYVHLLFWDPELSRMHLHPQIQIPNAFPVIWVRYDEKNGCIGIQNSKSFIIAALKLTILQFFVIIYIGLKVSKATPAILPRSSVS